MRRRTFQPVLMFLQTGTQTEPAETGAHTELKHEMRS